MFAAYQRSAGQVVVEAQGVLDEYENVDPNTRGRIREAIGEVLVTDAMRGLPSSDGKKTRGSLVNALIFLAVGIAFVGAGAVMFAVAPDTDATTTGTVQRVDEHRNRKGTTKCWLDVSFMVGEREYRADSEGRTRHACRYSAGDQIDVRYSSKNPAVNDTGMRQTTGGLLFSGFGTLPALVGLWHTVVVLAGVRFGRRLMREGADLAGTHPARPGAETAVAEAREKLTALLSQRRGGTTKFIPFGSSPDSQPASTAAANDFTGPPPNLAAGPTVQPGWYPTTDGADLRWHDGYQWTEHTRPDPTAQPPAT